MKSCLYARKEDKAEFGIGLRSEDRIACMLHVYMRVFMHACMQEYICVCNACMYECVYACMQACKRIYVCMYAGIYVCIHISMNVYTCMYNFVHIMYIHVLCI